MGDLEHLEPKSVFRYFERLCSVPHGSGNTKQISDLCCRMAEELGLAYRQDSLNNVVIRKPASDGYEGCTPVILQGHIDMVCVAEEGSGIDLSLVGPRPLTDGEWVWADRTSLGGDDGIAVAIIFAVLADDSLPHPALEAVLTVDEEVGMDGAMGLDCSDLQGRTLLNLDSEDEGVFTVSCAGGAVANCTFPGTLTSFGGMRVFSVSVAGLRGGHSGVEINKGRGNAIQILSRILCAAAESVPGLRLCSIAGGRFDNVICPKCAATVAVPCEAAERFADLVAAMDQTVRSELAGTDPEVTVSCEAGEADAAFSPEETLAALRGMFAIPQGIQAMSAELPGLVQTSLNKGSVERTAEGIFLRISVRSALDTEKDMVLDRIRTVMALTGGTVQITGAYPGWKYRPVSPVRERVLEAYRRVAGKEGRVEAIHAGLECGLFMEKIPELDAVSIGPEIRNIHSAEERLNVASVQRLYRVVCLVLGASK